MRVFFDTNVIIAAYAAHGACNELFNHCLVRHVMYTSDFVLKEVHEKLLRKIKLAANETALIVHFLRLNCRIVPETTLTRHVLTPSLYLCRERMTTQACTSACYYTK